ncbi:MAG TPA: hypothetical protein VM537_27485, partial [Anaerolineae bacterium]|nr:hypothetical protein [Anaerolineae bacterium]
MLLLSVAVLLLPSWGYPTSLAGRAVAGTLSEPFGGEQISSPVTPQPAAAETGRVRMFLPVITMAGDDPLASALLAPEQYSGLGACIATATSGSTTSCSANDLQLGTFLAIVDDGCVGPNDTFRAIVTAVVGTTANERYDLGVWVNVRGASAVNPASGSDVCFREILHPVATSDTNVEGRYGPFWDLEEGGDLCGDAKKNESNRIVLNGGQPLTLPCRDSNGDGIVDFSAAASYDQTKSNTCTSFAHALPGAPPKCKVQEAMPIAGVTVPNLSLSKSCSPDSVAPGGSVRCTIVYANSGDGAATGFSLVDDYDQSKGAVSNIGATSPGGNGGTNNGD